MSSVNGKLGNNAVPGWQVPLFAGAGSIGFLIILAFGDFVYKYTRGHRAYSDLIWVGMMLGGMVGAVCFYRILAQGYHLGIELFRGLQWYNWLWAVIFISGRLEWWEVALQQFANYPFTGLGMWAAARYGVLAKLGFTQTSSIHSDWEEIIVGTGAWGVIPVVVLMAVAWWVLVRATINRNIAIEYRQLAYEGMAVLSVVTARMLFGTDLSLHPPCHFFVALGAAEFLRRKLKRQERWEQLPAHVSPVAA